MLNLCPYCKGIFLIKICPCHFNECLALLGVGGTQKPMRLIAWVLGSPGQPVCLHAWTCSSVFLPFSTQILSPELGSLPSAPCPPSLSLKMRFSGCATWFPPQIPLHAHFWSPHLSQPLRPVEASQPPRLLCVCLKADIPPHCVLQWRLILAVSKYPGIKYGEQLGRPTLSVLSHRLRKFCPPTPEGSGKNPDPIQGFSHTQF